MAEYDQSYRPPPWWIEEAEPIIKKDWFGRRDELATRAMALMGSTKKWESSRITKMLNGENGTRPMVIGVSLVIGVPPPVYEARTLAEASRLQQAAKSFDPVDNSTPDGDAKRVAVGQRLTSAVKAKADQTAPVESSNEGKTGSRGARRAPRGG